MTSIVGPCDVNDVTVVFVVVDEVVDVCVELIFVVIVVVLDFV